MPASTVIFWVGLCLIGLLGACRAEIPDATYVCAETSECPPGMFCDETRGLCVRETPCVPLTCEDLRAECGTPDDRCGGTLDCGGCEGELTCGVPAELLCGCEPMTCESTGAECGVVDPGCGAAPLDCGGCVPPSTCSGGGEAGVCGCVDPDPCLGRVCGEVIDVCGEIVSCGVCASGESCPAGMCSSTPCTPSSMACASVECGNATDGCGGTVACGDCSEPESCVGGACECIATETCDSLGLECGSRTNICGEMETCTNMCVGAESCQSNICVCEPDRYEENDTDSMATIRTVSLGMDGGVELIRDANIEAMGDDDYYEWPYVADTLNRPVTVNLSRIPTGEDYDLRVIVRCAGGPSAEPACTPPAVPTMSGLGCESLTRGSGSESVTIAPACLRGDVVVRVIAVTAGIICGDYQLDVRTN